MAMQVSQESLLAPRRTLSRAVAEEIQRQIREGALRPGDRLPTERDLMTTFAVGRNTVREAVQSLVAMGVVDVRPGRGTRILTASNGAVAEAITMSALLAEPTVNDLFDFRTLLEGEMAALAAERATETDLVQISQAQAAHERVASHGLSVHEVDLAFHRSIAHASHNVIYTRVHDVLCDLLTGARPATDTVLGADESAREHKQVVTAIRAHNPIRSRDAMQHHFRSSLRRLEKARELGLVPAMAAEAKADAPSRRLSPTRGRRGAGGR